MKCPRCGRPGRKALSGYCTKVHKALDKTAPVVLECARCGTRITRVPSRIAPGGKAYCPRCPKNSGETHPRWKEGQYINVAGYRMVLVKGTYTLEHRHTWEQANRACILPEASGTVVVHHINMNKLDNRPQNLCLLSNKVHGRLHRFIDAGKYEAAKQILLEALEQHLFFTSFPEILEHYRSRPLKEFLKSGAP